LKEFHNSDDEPTCNRVITIHINDNVKFSIKEYREKLYEDILRRKKELRKKQLMRKK